MHAQYRPLPYARLNTFHGPKRQLLGNQAGQAAPAWKTGHTMGQIGVAGQVAKEKISTQEQGSKILLSRLPVDVGEKEVEELFRKTVGPLKESFLIYNSQGKSKGMAVVAFQRPGDAVAARAKYDGKIVDGRRPIKIEVVLDDAPTNLPSMAYPQAPSLLNRMGIQPPIPTAKVINAAAAPIYYTTPIIQTSQASNSHTNRTRPSVSTPTSVQVAPLPPRKFRTKKGPRRIKKQLAKSKEQLDKDMEDYRASADL